MTRINWATRTVNFWRGCKEVSTGCANCYARRIIGADFHTVIRGSHSIWRAAYGYHNDVIFTCSMSDFGHPAADAWRPDAWKVIRECSDNLWIILSKRLDHLRETLPPDWGDGWDHVVIGTSASTQAIVEKRAGAAGLKSFPAKMKVLSLEPLLEPIPNLWMYITSPDQAHRGFAQWVIVGGESNPSGTPRPMRAEWAEDIRQQCLTAGTAFHFKQMGGSHKVKTDTGNDWGGDKLFGETYQSMPFPVPKSHKGDQPRLF